MEENNFEKQLQQKMDELKIQPSDVVWEKIEVQIAKRGSRKGRLVILFLFIGLILSGSYWLWNIRSHSVSEHNSFLKNNPENNPNGIILKENKILQPKINSTTGLLKQNNNKEENFAAENRADKNSSHHQKLSTSKKINAKINSGEKAVVTFSEPQQLADKIFKNPAAKQNTIQIDKIHPENKSAINDSSSTKLNKDSVINQTSFPNAIAKEKDTSKQIPVTSKTVKGSKKNKWHAALLFSGGISNIANKILSADNSYSYVSDPNSANSNPGMISHPATLKNGFGFLVGFFEEKNILPKTKIAFGLNFKSFRSVYKVGRKNDTTGFYNSQNAVYNYTGYYNFIDLPVTIRIQIGKGKNVPFSWQGGFVISELINSNALQFNPSTGYYYKDNSIFNKTQIGFNTALYANLFSKQKNSVLIGPYFFYGASKISNEGLYNKKHFVFTGLRTEIIFGK